MNIQLRNKLISIFVVIWLVIFYYESTRYYYLEPMLNRNLPQMKFLYPPAGWIMFYNVEDNFGYTEVYGVKDGEQRLIDPHEIFKTRAIGYDNINRNVMLDVLSPEISSSFCAFLQRKFPYFDKFNVTYVQYPHLTKNPLERTQTVVYTCGGE